jgi:hypothetical protein
VCSLGASELLAGDMSGEVITAALLLEALVAQNSVQQRADLLSAAGGCEAAFQRIAVEIRDQARTRLRIGAPPSLRRLVGISNLEVPMNRVIGWMLDPASRGPAARSGLVALASLLGFAALSDDIEQGSPLEVLVETSPDLGITNRQPDLMIRSQHAAILVENKVASPESGTDQYTAYLDALRVWAGQREYRAYLLAPTERSTPPGWDGSLSHQELADALRPLTVEPTLSFWDRVVYGLIVSDLDPDTKSDRQRELERLIDNEHSLSEVAVATRLSQLLRHPTIDPTNGGF